MRLIVTGGGTGGHVYPALEIARSAIGRGHDVMYFGSQRGQEKAVCEREGILFRAFPSEPFFGFGSVRGLRSGWNLFWAGQKAKRAMRHADPDTVFSTGGYSSSPVVSAARALEIPYVILEQNSVPGRVNLGAGPHAHAVCTVFKATEPYFTDSTLIRTGMPLRSELRKTASLPLHRVGKPMVLVMGGSQGAEALNAAALLAAQAMGTDVRWMHLTGKAHFEAVAARAGTELAHLDYEVRAFLDGPEMASALASSWVAVCRSGAGTLSELAAFRIPSVLIPYPLAFGGHQLRNAQEIAELGAAKVIEQSVLSPSLLEEAITGWLRHEERRKKAGDALAGWDMPEATAVIMEMLERAAIDA